MNLDDVTARYDAATLAHENSLDGMIDEREALDRISPIFEYDDIGHLLYAVINLRHENDKLRGVCSCKPTTNS